MVIVMEATQLDMRFGRLSEITDRLAQINTIYDTDVDRAFDEMEEFTKEVMTWDPGTMGADSLRSFLSHMSFHREVVADIIAEARRLLLPERRESLKKLVNYHKNFVKWFSRIERQYAA